MTNTIFRSSVRAAIFSLLIVTAWVRVAVAQSGRVGQSVPLDARAIKAADASQKPASPKDFVPEVQAISLGTGGPNIQMTPDGAELTGETQLWTSTMVRVPCQFDATLRIQHGAIEWWYSRNAMKMVAGSPGKISIGGKEAVANIEANRWLKVNWTITAEGASLTVDGKKILEYSRNDMKGVVAPLAFIARNGCTFEVKSLSYSELTLPLVLDAHAVPVEQIRNFHTQDIKTLDDRIALLRKQSQKSASNTPRQNPGLFGGPRVASAEHRKNADKALADEIHDLTAKRDALKDEKPADVAAEIVAINQAAEQGYQAAEDRVAKQIQAYRLAADNAKNGDMVATSRLGAILIDGDGVPVDESAGIQLLIKAAESGNKVATSRLADYYFHQSVYYTKDAGKALALQWNRKAADLGDELAAQHVEELTGTNSHVAGSSAGGTSIQHTKQKCPTCGGTGLIQSVTAGSSGSMDKITGGNHESSSPCPRCHGTGYID